MQKEKLRELAVVLFEKVKQNASIDWTIKESVRAKLKVIVKRTLRQTGFKIETLPGPPGKREMIRAIKMD